MKIAWVGHGWDTVMQRPHHWRKQAVARGHEFDVFTMHAYSLKKWFASLWEARHVHRVAKSIIEIGLRRTRRRPQADARLARRFEAFIQKRVMEACGSRYDVVIYGTYPLEHIRRTTSKGILVYDCMDEWSGFSWLPPDVARWENDLVRQCDLVAAVSPPLYERFTAARGADRTLLVPNACDYELFSAVSKDAGDTQGFVIGYVGSVHEWFDWEAVLAVASAYPNALVRIVGPVSGPRIDLPGNVQLTGPQPYGRIPAFVAGFDVCIIPFKRSPLIDATSPIKLYEFLAAGKPVVSSDMPDCRQFRQDGIVHIAGCKEEYVREVLRAYYAAHDPRLVERRRELARMNTWDMRWRSLEKKIYEVMTA